MKKRSGLFIVFLGSDGVGKTTLINSLENRLQEQTPLLFAMIKKYHWRPCLFKGRSNYSSKSCSSNPHDVQLDNMAISMLKLFFLFFDFLFGYYFKIYPALRKNELVLFDRYYYDLFLDPKRYRFGGPISCVKWLLPIIPYPNLIVYLDGPAMTIHQRKFELTIDEIKEQQNRFLNLKPHIRNIITLDCEDQINDLVDVIFTKILSIISLRMDKTNIRGSFS